LIITHKNKTPIIPENIFIADNATIIGDVIIAEKSSVWFQSVIRGDTGPIRVGANTNIQDFTMIHVPTGGSCEIGDNVTVGHKAMIHGCKIGNNCLIGMNAVIMDNAEIGDSCIIGAGSLITEGSKIPAKSIIFGSPAKVRRELREEELAMLQKSADHYYEYSLGYL